MTHEILTELLPLYALGALETDDRKLVDSHLATGCTVCSQDLLEFEATVSHLAWLAPPAAPPKDLRDRLLGSLEPRKPSTATEAGPIPFRPRPPTPKPLEPQPRVRSGPLAAVAALATAAAIAVVFLAWALLSASRQLDTAVRQLASAESNSKQLERELKNRDELLALIRDPEVRLTRLSEGEEQPKPGIDVLWHPEHLRGYLYARNLPKVEPNKAYELWLIADNTPIPAAVFNTDENGNAVIEIKKLPTSGKPQKFAVTVEPSSGSQQPTSPIILAGNYQG